MPREADPLPWDELEHVDGVYFTGGDPGAVRLARRANVLVATARELPVLREAGVQLDVLLGSTADSEERYKGGLDPAPRYVVRTQGARVLWTRTLWRERQQLKIAREIMAGKRDGMGRKVRPEDRPKPEAAQ